MWAFVECQLKQPSCMQSKGSGMSISECRRDGRRCRCCKQWLWVWCSMIICCKACRWLCWSTYVGGSSWVGTWWVDLVVRGGVGCQLLNIGAVAGGDVIVSNRCGCDAVWLYVVSRVGGCVGRRMLVQELGRYVMSTLDGRRGGGMSTSECRRDGRRCRCCKQWLWMWCSMIICCKACRWLCWSTYVGGRSWVGT